MTSIQQLKKRQRLLIIPLIGVLIVAAVFLSTRPTGGEDKLDEAVEGGELALTSVGRNYESLASFLKKDEAQSRQLLEAAKAALETARTKLDSAGRTDDEYVHGMLDNYRRLGSASETMSKGMDNLLFISENLTRAIDYYSKGDYDKAAVEAAYCLEVLTPLLGEFDTSNTDLNGITVLYVPSGQKDRLTVRVSQYRNEREIYRQCVLLLQSLMQGQEYLKQNALLEDYLRQLQEAIAKQDYETAQKLRQQMSDLLQSLQSQSFQDAANLASQLDPEKLSGKYSQIAQELQNKLKDMEELDDFQNYLLALQKYLEALQMFSQDPSNTGAIQQLMADALNRAGQGAGSGNGELQGLYDGLKGALNELSTQLFARSPPPPG
jgi:hypothetical protein